MGLGWQANSHQETTQLRQYVLQLQCFFSVVLLALVDADYKFIWIDTGGEDHQSGGQLFGASELKECIDDNTINFPDSHPLANDDRDIPYCWIVPFPIELLS